MRPHSRDDAGSGSADTTIVGECAHCEGTVTAHDNNPSGDYIVWERHTGESEVYCNLYHLQKGFEHQTGERLTFATGELHAARVR